MWIVFTIVCLVGAVNDASRKYEEKIFNTKTDTNSSDSETDETETEFEEDDEDNTETRWNHFVTALHLKTKDKNKDDNKEPEIKKPPLLLKIARYIRYVIVIGYLALHNYYDIPSVISFVFGIYIGKELFMSEYATIPTTLLSPDNSDYIINLKDLKSIDKIKHFLKQPHYKEVKERIIKALNIQSSTSTPVSTPIPVSTPRNRDNNNNTSFFPPTTPSNKNNNNNKEFNIDTSLTMKSPQSTNPVQQQQQNTTPSSTTPSASNVNHQSNNSNQSDNKNTKKSNLLPPPIKPPILLSVVNTPVKDNTDTLLNKSLSVSKNSNNPAMQRLNSIGSPLTKQTPALAKKQNMIIPHVNKEVVLAEIERVQKLYGSKPFMFDIIKYVKEKRR